MIMKFYSFVHAFEMSITTFVASVLLEASTLPVPLGF